MLKKNSIVVIIILRRRYVAVVLILVTVGIRNVRRIVKWVSTLLMYLRTSVGRVWNENRRRINTFYRIYIINIKNTRIEYLMR